MGKIRKSAETVNETIPGTEPGPKAAAVNSDKIEITEISYVNGTTTITYEEERPSQSKSFKTVFKSTQAPAPEFVNQFNEFSNIFRLITGIDDYDFNVRKIKFKHGKKGKYSVMITALKMLKLTNRPLNTTTPLVDINPGQDDHKDLTLIGEACSYMLILAKNFLNGEIAQGKIFPE